MRLNDSFILLILQRKMERDTSVRFFLSRSFRVLPCVPYPIAVRVRLSPSCTILPQLVGAIGKSKKAYVVCCQPGAKADFGTGVRGAADVRDINAKNLPPAKAGDVVVVVTPVRHAVSSVRSPVVQGFTHPESVFVVLGIVNNCDRVPIVSFWRSCQEERALPCWRACFSSGCLRYIDGREPSWRV